MTKIIILCSIVVLIVSVDICFSENIYICGKYVSIGDLKESTLKEVGKNCLLKKDDSDNTRDLYNFYKSKKQNMPDGYIHFNNGVVTAANKDWGGTSSNDISMLYMSMFAVLSQNNQKHAQISTARRVFDADHSSDDISIFIENKEIQISHNLFNGVHGYYVNEYLWDLNK